MRPSKQSVLCHFIGLLFFTIGWVGGLLLDDLFMITVGFFALVLWMVLGIEADLYRKDRGV